MSHSKTRSRRHDLVVVALLTFALCVAMNVAIFAVIHSALLRCLPFPTPDLLVTVFKTHPIVEVKPHRAAAVGILIPDFADLVDKRVRLSTRLSPKSKIASAIVSIRVIQGPGSIL